MPPDDGGQAGCRKPSSGTAGAARLRVDTRGARQSFRSDRLAVYTNAEGHANVLKSMEVQNHSGADSRRTWLISCHPIYQLSTPYQDRDSGSTTIPGCRSPKLDRRHLGDLSLGRCPFLALWEQQGSATGSKGRHEAKVENPWILRGMKRDPAESGKPTQRAANASCSAC
jgi:hypothetical protein